MKISFLKILLNTLVGLSAVVFLSVCVEPHDKKEFFQDDEVQELIRRTRVNLTDRTSDRSLIVGNQVISGIKSDRYYRVEEADDDETFLGDRFVASGGTLSVDFEDLVLIKSGIITNLRNDHHYTVYDSRPLTGNLTIFDTATYTPGMGGIPIVAGNNGIKPNLPDETIFLDLTSVLNASLTPEILQIPVNPPDSNTIITPVDGNVIELISDEDSITDYVILERNGSGDIVNFRVLRVTIGDPAPITEFTVIITALTIAGVVPTFTPNSTTVSQDALLTGAVPGISIQISNAATLSLTGIEWWYYGNSLGTGSSLDLSLSSYDNSGYFALGANIITVTFKIGDIYYSADYTINVNP